MTLITTKSDLEHICNLIDESGRFGMDLEFIPERTYTAELCLVQIATNDEVFLIDPLALPDLTPIWQRIANPDLLKVLHAGDQDLDLMFTASRLLPQNVMDTQIAAGFIGFGYPVGYGKLLQQLLNISISKTESYTDWTHRPLSKSQIEYAIDDVRHLLPMYDRLVERLQSMNRAEWVKEECKKYSELEYYNRDRTNDFFRVKGANTLNRRGLAVLRELTGWRHGEAHRINKPLKSILQDGILLEFARRPPKDLADIQRIRGVRPDQARQYGAGLLKAVKEGLAVADEELPRWPQTRIPSRREVLMADVLYTVLRVICFDLDIATELVATRGILEALVRQHVEGNLQTSTLPIMHGWRHEMAGKQLVEMLDGASLVMQFRDDEHPVHMELERNGHG
ncbi:MAG TPA: ribonuclease D [Candidatus Obscuribacterales bacterium]